MLPHLVHTYLVYILCRTCVNKVQLQTYFPIHAGGLGIFNVSPGWRGIGWPPGRLPMGVSGCPMGWRMEDSTDALPGPCIPFPAVVWVFTSIHGQSGRVESTDTYLQHDYSSFSNILKIENTTDINNSTLVFLCHIYPFMDVKKKKWCWSKVFAKVHEHNSPNIKVKILSIKTQIYTVWSFLRIICQSMVCKT